MARAHGPPPLQVHTDGCHMAGSRRRPLDRDEARRLLTEGMKARGHCQPDVRLREVRAAPGTLVVDRPGRPRRRKATHVRRAVVAQESMAGDQGSRTQDTGC
ncbi:DUF6233 domain-containing protein [Streptomyces tendae]|uniref:DUF6233 domain-containing protein n=1 Tax=Streptomyces tendae TaxID=1932 RepID=UPI002493B76B|nr:DUF6233 domain-containing protein [Streptomyces tendae]